MKSRRFASRILDSQIRESGQKPQDLAKALIEKMDQSLFEKVEIAGPGFINFKLKTEVLTAPSLSLRDISPKGGEKSGKILLEYFQPNIAKPLHIGHLRTAIIGDALKRMLVFTTGQKVESDTHMGDWGTQFGILTWAYKKMDGQKLLDAHPHDPIEAFNKLYVEANALMEKDPALREEAKQEFVKLEQGDKENRSIWKLKANSKNSQIT